MLDCPFFKEWQCLRKGDRQSVVSMEDGGSTRHVVWTHDVRFSVVPSVGVSCGRTPMGRYIPSYI